MNICVVVVWYNPDADFVKNIHSYASRVGRIYVIDNSTEDNSALLSEVENAVYIANGENRGIAAALNQGCERALSDGFEWAMTMDQDSHWEENTLDKYLRLCEEHTDGRTVSFGPGTKGGAEPKQTIFHRVLRAAKQNPVIRRMFGKEPIVEMESGAKSVDRLITSGNIIFLAAWQDVGKFLDPLFIDEIDHEFCFRLKERGYEIVRFPGVKMGHQLGKTPKKAYFFPPVTYHSGVRLYYIYRNCAYEKKLHPEFFKKCKYKKDLRHRWLEVILNLRFSQLKYITRGWYCARHEMLGRYEDWYAD